MNYMIFEGYEDFSAMESAFALGIEQSDSAMEGLAGNILKRIKDFPGDLRRKAGRALESFKAYMGKLYKQYAPKAIQDIAHKASGALKQIKVKFFQLIKKIPFIAKAFEKAAIPKPMDVASVGESFTSMINDLDFAMEAFDKNVQVTRTIAKGNLSPQEKNFVNTAYNDAIAEINSLKTQLKESQDTIAEQIAKSPSLIASINESRKANIETARLKDENANLRAENERLQNKVNSDAVTIKEISEDNKAMNELITSSNNVAKVTDPTSAAKLMGMIASLAGILLSIIMFIPRTCGNAISAAKEKSGEKKAKNANA